MYEKPLILSNEDLAEGIYAASGASAFSYALSLAGGWDGNKNYNITFTNGTDEKVEAVTVTLKVHGNVTGIDGNVTGVLNGSTATVTFNNYGNGIQAKTSVGPIYMHVTGTGDFSLE